MVLRTMMKFVLEQYIHYNLSPETQTGLFRLLGIIDNKEKYNKNRAFIARLLEYLVEHEKFTKVQLKAIERL